MNHIVVYMGGACGDLITALIDPGEAGFGSNGNVLIKTERSRLKKPHEFDTDFDKDTYLNSIFAIYKSIPSHDIEYHIRSHHRFIGIAVSTRAAAIWAAERFKRLHRLEVWNEMTQSCGVQDINEYAQSMLDYSKMLMLHTNDVLLLEDILEGNTIGKLTDLVPDLLDKPAATEFYNSWLAKQSQYHI